RRRRDHADHHRRRADPHPGQGNPRTRPRYSGGNPDQPGDRREAFRAGENCRNRRRPGMSPDAMSPIYNFAAGPAVLPAEVLAQARDEMLDWHGCGMSVMEMSHRGQAFASIITAAEADLRELL